MKFSSSLKFNAVSEWWDEYIAYDVLKKYIYQLEKQQAGLSNSFYDAEANERTPLARGGMDQATTDAIFTPLLDKELLKVTVFYETQEKELLEELEGIQEQIRIQEETGLEGDYYEERYRDDEAMEDDDSPAESPVSTVPRKRFSPPGAQRIRTGSLLGGRVTTNLIIPESPPRQRASSEARRRRVSMSSSEGGHDLEASVSSLRNPRATLGRLAGRLSFFKDPSTSISSDPETIWTAQTHYAYDTRLLFKRRITNLYVSLTSLRSYVEVNRSGFRKILKKYDKVTFSELKEQYLHNNVEQARPFTQHSRERLNAAIDRLVSLYAKCVTYGDEKAALQQLKLFQRENIAWERDTVWRQMIGKERRGEGADGIAKVLAEDGEGVVGRGRVRDPGLFSFRTPLGKLKITRKKISLAVAIAIFAILLGVKIFEGEEANKCFAILIFCTVLWATEAIPLFVTSIMVPLLLVTLRVIRDDHTKDRLGAKDATHFVFSIMFSPTIMLLIGGFTISSALSKTNIDRILITRVLSLAGSKPASVLLAFMCVACFASMLISNVAAPTLCFTLIRPILRTLPSGATFGPALVLGIALAANIGGQSSPISSPQNLIALEAMHPPLDWARWFAVALPVSAISILLIWALLLVSYRPSQSPEAEGGTIEIRTIRPTREPFTLKQYWVSFVTVVTIGLWCVAHALENWVGDMGVIAIVPILAFFATGVLKKDDFEQFAWTIIFLAMGGIALGKGVVSSGLLEIMGVHIEKMLDGFSLYAVVMILSPIVLVISTFISHTIAAVLLVPIAKTVGENFGSHANLLIFITGLICSTGMGMPVSGFPNQTAAQQENELGEPYLTNIDFLKNGVPASIIATLVVSTVGFLLMKTIGL